MQASPDGLAQAFLIGEEFLGGTSSSDVILGDNLFFGSGFSGLLNAAASRASGATVFAYPVSNPEAFGVVAFNKHGIATSIKPSPRGELEITDLTRIYLKQGRLDVQLMARGMAWLDTDTHDSILEAVHFIQTLEKRQGPKVGYPQEGAWRMGWID